MTAEFEETPRPEAVGKQFGDTGSSKDLPAGVASEGYPLDIPIKSRLEVPPEKLSAIAENVVIHHDDPVVIFGKKNATEGEKIVKEKLPEARAEGGGNQEGVQTDTGIAVVSGSETGQGEVVYFGYEDTFGILEETSVDVKDYFEHILTDESRADASVAIRSTTDVPPKNIQKADAAVLPDRVTKRESVMPLDSELRLVKVTHLPGALQVKLRDFGISPFGRSETPEDVTAMIRDYQHAAYERLSDAIGLPVDYRIQQVIAANRQKGLCVADVIAIGSDQQSLAEISRYDRGDLAQHLTRAPNNFGVLSRYLNIGFIVEKNQTNTIEQIRTGIHESNHGTQTVSIAYNPAQLDQGILAYEPELSSPESFFNEARATWLTSMQMRHYLGITGGKGIHELYGEQVPARYTDENGMGDSQTYTLGAMILDLLVARNLSAPDTELFRLLQYGPRSQGEYSELDRIVTTALTPRAGLFNKKLLGNFTIRTDDHVKANEFLQRIIAAYPALQGARHPAIQAARVCDELFKQQAHH